MKVLRLIRNYFFYCGIEKNDYNALKKDAYISNFKIWRALHFLMVATFGGLYISSLISDAMKVNSIFYLGALIYSLFACVCFFLLKKDSILAQFMIYLSISVLLIFGIFITKNKPDFPGVTFIVFILITPLLMVDKPYFMALELGMAALIYLVWMYHVKPYKVWRMDLINVLTFTLVGIFLNILANSIRIKEFVLARQIIIQKDTDDLTGLMNKGALTREINAFLDDEKSDKGLMFLFDIDKFKSINDTFGHDVGDEVIEQLGRFLRTRFCNGEIAGRFGGDEFIVFVKNTNDITDAGRIAEEIVSGAADNVTLPDDQKVSVSIGIAVYNGEEKEYKKIFKKADTALYRAKADSEKRFSVF